MNNNTRQHPNHEFIVAFANGQEVQFKNKHGIWVYASLRDLEDVKLEFRIKPSKPDFIVRYAKFGFDVDCGEDYTYMLDPNIDGMYEQQTGEHNLKVTLKLQDNGEYYVLHSVEVI